MDLKEFRIAHSTLIEHYQFIEAHLEGIYAAVSDQPFLDGIRNSLISIRRPSVFFLIVYHLHKKLQGHAPACPCAFTVYLHPLR